MFYIFECTYLARNNYSEKTAFEVLQHKNVILNIITLSYSHKTHFYAISRLNTCLICLQILKNTRISIIM